MCPDIGEPIDAHMTMIDNNTSPEVTPGPGVLASDTGARSTKFHVHM